MQFALREHLHKVFSLKSYQKARTTKVARILFSLFFFFSVLFGFWFDGLGLCFFKPRVWECVNQAVGASSANEIRLEQLLFVKTFRLSACKVLNLCIPGGRPHGPQKGRFTA